MIRHTAFVMIALCSALITRGQQRIYVFAHNDYLHQRPFYSSYARNVDYIEADVFLKGGELLVAHTRAGLDPERTLEVLYLEPIEEEIRANAGRVYADSIRSLTLMIDLKSSGEQTLRALVHLLSDFPMLTNCSSLTIAVSGDVPPPNTWTEYPAFIHFDGRPSVKYSDEQLQRVSLISASFKDYSSWNGRGEMSNEDRLRLEAVVRQTHAMNKRFRFWGAPDFEVAWKLLVGLGVDVVNTDDVNGATMFVRGR